MDLVSWQRIHTFTHRAVHRHSELYGNVNLVSPENAASDLTVYPSLSLIFILSFSSSSSSCLCFSSDPEFCIKWQQTWWRDVRLPPLRFIFHLAWEQREREHRWCLKLKAQSETGRKKEDSLLHIVRLLFPLSQDLVEGHRCQCSSTPAFSSLRLLSGGLNLIFLVGLALEMRLTNISLILTF